MSRFVPDETRTLIDELLDQQQRLTAVERFAIAHERGDFSKEAGFYHRLLPAAPPLPGQQYAFEVDLDKCSGCKACVSACHSLNGLDDGETWRDVGLLFSEDWRRPFQQTITTACHHCVDPGCLNGCPVLAYDKDPHTGIVRHLDDQCIGCQYCVMKCPYDVPKYSARRGIVRKCDMCANRLSVGEAPACAQACPHEAIRITIVDQAEITARSHAGTFLPDAPDPDYTRPTTQYKSRHPLPKDLQAGDHARITPAPSHRPLVFLLVLSQLAVGTSVLTVLINPMRRFAFIPVLAGLLAFGIGLLHLGRPLKAWRAFLGWRRSWFSREVIALGGFLVLAGAHVAVVGLNLPTILQKAFAVVAAGLGLAAVASSAMVYADTRREFWRASQCFAKFFGTTLLLGLAVTLASVAFQPLISMRPLQLLAASVFLVTLVKLGFENRILRHWTGETVLTPLNKTALLLEGELGRVARARVGFGIIGGLILPALVLLPGETTSAAIKPLAVATLILCLSGELLERYLFFTAVAPAKMPGGAMS
jgi:Fe-S-cluster-containing dehydrogenase component/DMSO reductase anchor subunit